MKMPNTPKIETLCFKDKKETQDMLKAFDAGDYYSENYDDIIPVGFDPIFTYMGQVDEHTPWTDTIGVLHALTSNVQQNLERFFNDLDKHLGDVTIIRRRFGNWEHPENEAVGVEIVQRSPKIEDMTSYDLAEAAKAKGHDVDAMLRDLAGRDPDPKTVMEKEVHS